MKSLLWIASLGILASCSKQDQSSNVVENSTDPETCLFGETNFNLSKRATISDELSGRGKPPKTTGGTTGGGTGGTGGGGTTSGTPSVVLLDFDGHTVSGTNWNTTGDINCSPANLSYAAITAIFNRVANDYSPFNITVTTDENVFNSVAPNKRMRVIITETWEWFGQAGGTAFVNSFGLYDNTPCFVFSSLLNYNEKNIGEAASHEMGHTLGLRHQAAWSGGVMVSQYYYGHGSGETGWAPIMGCAYNQNVSTWHNGPTTTGANSSQDEVPLVANKIGWITDDYTNTTSGAATLNSSLNGVLNSSADIDFFYINTSVARTIDLRPFNIGAGNIAANMDLKLNIYNAQGQLLSTVNDPSVLNAYTTVTAGQYYVSVSAVANSNSSTYGMLGKYSINVY